MCRVTHEHHPRVCGVLLRSEDKVRDADGPRLGVFGQAMDQGLERLGPVLGQGLHQGDSLAIIAGDGDVLGIRPRDDDLAQVFVFAAVFEVVRCVEDYGRD